MPKFLKFLPILLLLCSSSYSQYISYDWFAGKCTYSGEYDTTHYSRKQLDDTKILCYDIPASGIFSFTTESWTPEKIASLDTNLLKQEYESNLKFIRSLTLVKSPYWEKQRQNKINALKDVYDLLRLSVKSFKHPEVLKKFSVPDSTCRKYINAMIKGGDSLLVTWKSYRDQQCRKNPNPKLCLDETYNKKLSSKQKYDWARLDLTMHAWWDCAIRYIKHKEDPALLDKEFRKIFRNATYGCEH